MPFYKLKSKHEDIDSNYKHYLFEHIDEKDIDKKVDKFIEMDGNFKELMLLTPGIFQENESLQSIFLNLLSDKYKYRVYKKIRGIFLDYGLVGGLLKKGEYLLNSKQTTINNDMVLLYTIDPDSPLFNIENKERLKKRQENIRVYNFDKDRKTVFGSSDLLSYLSEFLNSDSDVMNLHSIDKTANEAFKRRLNKYDVKGSLSYDNYKKARQKGIENITSVYDYDGDFKDIEGVKELKLSDTFVGNITYLPNSLTHLTFGNEFNQNISYIQFPENLTHLTFGNEFNQRITNVRFPENLTHLTFGKYFNQPITTNVTFPSTLTHLTFGNNFNQNISRIRFPESLTHLTFGNEFNNGFNRGNVQTFTYTFPSNLIHLTFGTEFNQNITNVTFPESLTHLTFGDYFEQTLDDNVSLSNTKLTHLTFGRFFNKDINNVKFPLTLTHLTLGEWFNSIINNGSLNNLKYLKLDKYYKKSLSRLPKTIEKLLIGEKEYKYEKTTYKYYTVVYYGEE